MSMLNRAYAPSGTGFALAISLSAAAYSAWKFTGWSTAPVGALHLLLAIMPCAWFFGVKSGLLATALGLYSFALSLTPVHSLMVDSPHRPRLLGFLCVTLALLWVITAARSSSQALLRAIGELKAKNEALAKSEELLRMVLSTLPVGVQVTDGAGNTVMSNIMVERIWGAGVPASGAERWARSQGFWHESGEPIAPEQWASVRALVSGEVSLNELIDIRTFDGSQKILHNSAAPFRDPAGRIVGAVIVNEDVTARIRAEEALRSHAVRLQQLSRRLFAVQEEERRNLSRELHDEFGQLLATASMQLRAAINAGGERSRELLDGCVALLQRAGSQVRGLALDLRPMQLDTGLDSAMHWLAAQHEQRTGIVTRVSGHASDVSGAVAITCYRVAQEALTNVVRHARAQHAWIELLKTGDTLVMTVRDDGIGFDVRRTTERVAGTGRLGLLGMRERIEILDGTLDIESEVGRGTSIRICVRNSESGAPGAVPAP
jgi:signal transduction histidine kinase